MHSCRTADVPTTPAARAGARGALQPPFGSRRRAAGGVRGACAGLLALIALVAPPAEALDKQGSGAHGGRIAGGKEEKEGFGVSGALSLGVAFWNPSYAARPDNSGLALMRYAAHADIDLLGRKLSIPVDLNVFSDREAGGARMFAPSEVDILTGVTSTWGLGPGALELGVRVEHDRPVDDGGYIHDPPVGARAPNPGAAQTYADARARYLFSASALAPEVGHALRGGDLRGWLTLGWFAVNPTGRGTYFARPNNTGRALFRYAVHSEVSFFEGAVAFGYDFTFFTDSRSIRPLAPTELDLTTEIIFRGGAWEVHLAHERDLPLDEATLRQAFAYALVVWAFDAGGFTAPGATQARGPLP